jgi:four helix bundle protein
MTDFKKLSVWQRSRDVVKAVYTATNAFPVSEMGGMTSQLRRAAVSIPTNIAEGCARQSDREQARFFRMSLASARELESLALVARDVGFLQKPEAEPLIQELDELQAMMTALIKHRLRSGIKRRRTEPE